MMIDNLKNTHMKLLNPQPKKKSFKIVYEVGKDREQCNSSDYSETK